MKNERPGGVGRVGSGQSSVCSRIWLLISDFRTFCIFTFLRPSAFCRLPFAPPTSEHSAFFVPSRLSPSASCLLRSSHTQPSSLPSVAAATSRCLPWGYLRFRPPRRTPAQLSALVTPSRFLLAPEGYGVGLFFECHPSAGTQGGPMGASQSVRPDCPCAFVENRKFDSSDFAAIRTSSVWLSSPAS